MKNAAYFAVGLCAISFQCLFAAEPELLPRELLDQGWISLFDGQTLFGWEPVGEAKWEVVDGEIRTAGDAGGVFGVDDRVGRL